MKLDGIYPALVTPFDSTGQIDEKAMQRVIERNIKQGVQGFYACGSTAESLLLSYDERQYALETIVDIVDGRVDVIAHIGCFSTQDTINMAHHAVQLGVRAISALPPFYFKFTWQELTQFYLDVVHAVKHPLIVYNAPALTGVTFDSESLASVFENPYIAGVKYTSHNLYQMERLIKHNPAKNIIAGHDETYLSSLAIGCRCAIGSTFNFMSHIFLAVREAFGNGDMQAAQELQNTANDVIQLLIEMGVFRGVKGMLNVLGLSCGACRKPFSPLTREEYAQLEKAAQAIA